MMMYLDRIKAKKLLKTELLKEKIDEARLVLAGDESWNSETVYKDGRFMSQKEFKCYFGSYWAVPTLVIYYVDGKQKRIACFFTEKDDKGRAEKLEKMNSRQLTKFRKSVGTISKTLVGK